MLYSNIVWHLLVSGLILPNQFSSWENHQPSHCVIRDCGSSLANIALWGGMLVAGFSTWGFRIEEYQPQPSLIRMRGMLGSKQTSIDLLKPRAALLPGRFTGGPLLSWATSLQGWALLGTSVLSVSGRLSCFQAFSIGNSAAVNSLVLASFWKFAFMSLKLSPESGIAESKALCRFSRYNLFPYLGVVLFHQKF